MILLQGAYPVVDLCRGHTLLLTFAVSITERGKVQEPWMSATGSSGGQHSRDMREELICASINTLKSKYKAYSPTTL